MALVLEVSYVGNRSVNQKQDLTTNSNLFDLNNVPKGKYSQP